MLQHLNFNFSSYFLNRYAGVLLAVYIALIIISFWKIFRKAGQPGWSVLIPIYNFIILLDIIKKPWWWIFLLILAFPVNIVIFIIIINRLSHVFGKTSKFTAGIIFLSAIFLPWLAFGPAQYIPPQENDAPQA